MSGINLPASIEAVRFVAKVVTVALLAAYLIPQMDVWVQYVALTAGMVWMFSEGYTFAGEVMTVDEATPA